MTLDLARSWIQFVEEAGKEGAAQRRRAALMLRFLIQFLIAALTVRVGGTPSLAEPEDLRIVEQLAQRADAEQILEMLDRCLESDVQIERRVQLVLVLEALLDALGGSERSFSGGSQNRGSAGCSQLLWW